jgi:hypothetical protein
MAVSHSKLCLLLACGVSLGAFLAGCPSTDRGPPDGPPDDGGTQGLTLRWQSTQPIPTTADDPSVEEAELRLRSVRVIGDAASGDSATTRERVELKWSGDDIPEELRFDQAPPGKYAKIDVVLRGWDGDGGEDGEGASFEISGNVRVNGTTYRYQLEDDDQLSSSLPLPGGTMLSPGGELVLEVRVNLRDVVKDLEFSSIPPQGGTISINRDTPEVLDAARAALVAALTAQRADGDSRRGSSDRP